MFLGIEVINSHTIRFVLANRRRPVYCPEQEQIRYKYKFKCSKLTLLGRSSSTEVLNVLGTSSFVADVVIAVVATGVVDRRGSSCLV
jgi:hypothetical protein